MDDINAMEKRIEKLECELYNILQSEKCAEHEAKAKKNFLLNVSYELKSALTTIMETAETIIKESESHHITKYAYDIKNTGNTLLSVTNGIFELSKNELGQTQIIPVKYEFSCIISDIMNMTSKRVRDKGLEYSIHTAHDIPKKMYGDETRIKQIILILIINAVKQTEYGNITLDVSFDRKKNLLCIKVKDTGSGIKPEKLENIFDDYLYKENTEAKGFSLYITKQFVNLMNGHIECESEYGKGSVFTVCIPQVVIDDSPAVNSLKTETVNPFEPGKYKPSFTAPDAHILIVDDNRVNLKVAAAMLKETHIKISTADSGKECIEQIKQTKFDMIFLDQMMPEMNGLEALKIIRKHKIAAGIPIIAFTAEEVEHPMDFFINEGFDSYLQKPVVFKKLEKILIEFLPQKYINYI